jgi:hypothetical protein
MQHYRNVQIRTATLLAVREWVNKHNAENPSEKAETIGGTINKWIRERLGLEKAVPTENAAPEEKAVEQ